MNIFSDEGAPLMGAGGGGGSSIASLINSLSNLVKTGQYITFPMSEPDGDSLGVFFWLLPFSSQDASDMSNSEYSVMLFPARTELLAMALFVLLAAAFLVVMSTCACCCSRKTKDLGCTKPSYVLLLLISWVLVVANVFNCLLRYKSAYEGNDAQISMLSIPERMFLRNLQNPFSANGSAYGASKVGDFDYYYWQVTDVTCLIFIVSIVAVTLLGFLKCCCVCCMCCAGRKRGEPMVGSAFNVAVPYGAIPAPHPSQIKV